MSEQAEIEYVVIGAGVIGLAIARALAKAGGDVIVLERNAAIGQETSARNSEVIHAGLYYPKFSLKARLCVRGRALLYDYLEARHLPFRKCGKLIVASTADEMEALSAIAARGHVNGVEDLQEISGEQASQQEPALKCFAALHSPSTGIMDVHAFMLSLRGELEDHRGRIAFNAPFEAAEILKDGFLISVGGASPMQLKARHLINSAGLWAIDAAHGIKGLSPSHIPEPLYAKGNYFALNGRAPFSRLIYPVPESGGLGVHLTLDMGGAARFGPDVEFLSRRGDTFDYTVDPRRAAKFYTAIRRYWPGLPDNALTPAFSGIRPKYGSRDTASDFEISGEAAHGVPGLVNLFGIESPGLTASLAIAEEVSGLLST